jgi:MerR family copper efflux transcriptional regulator
MGGVDGLMVSELARRSGVPASTVRYYEQEGLLPARRSPSGYRLYDEVAVDRLAFIGTAKSLGLPLPEIRRLLEPWQHGECSDVQHELLPLVEQRMAETRDRIRELSGFADHLSRAHAQLEAIDRQGPCDSSCALLGREETVVGPVLASLPLVESADEAVIACGLDEADRDARATHWREVLAAATARAAIPGGVQLTLDRARLRLTDLVELAEAESRCCSFFDLVVHLGPPVRLDARAPEHALALVHELFGSPDPQ